MGNPRLRRWSWLPRAGQRTAHVEGRIITPDRDEGRLRYFPLPHVLPPGQSRYQSHSADLPSGVGVFHGLGAAETAITVDLTVLEKQDAIDVG